MATFLENSVADTMAAALDLKSDDLSDQELARLQTLIDKARREGRLNDRSREPVCLRPHVVRPPVLGDRHQVDPGLTASALTCQLLHRHSAAVYGIACG